MIFRSKLFVAAILCVACGAVVVAGIAGASNRAKTKVTIHEENGDFSGKVKSKRLHKCAENRKVKVFKQSGQHQNPRNDTKIASDVSELDGDHGVWSTGNTAAPPGKYYARARKTSKCKGDSSRTVRVQN